MGQFLSMNPTVLNSSLFVYHDLISAIVAAMEARDRYTASHSRRVSDMSEAICRLLCLPGELTDKIHIAADLHDIGKLGITDSVLMREGPLNEDEWERMKQHPIIGYDILRKVTSFHDIAILVRHHHERWDGHGYPDGITGLDIPLGSRIIAIADSIDAMMSDRLYRKKMSPEACQNELARSCGIMYDPLIVELALAHWDSIMSARELS
jgi:HD-GYP domain-containing protein (c-di-GMP phosphodiesterase class II)